MALKNLKDYYAEVNRNAFLRLIKQPCLITEKIQTSSFYIQNTLDGLLFFKNNNKQPLSLTDRTIVSYYERAVSYFQTLDSSVINKLPTNYVFGFDYMPVNQPLEIEYDQLPTNNLILTHIQVTDNSDRTKVRKIIREPEFLDQWAELLNVSKPSVLFNGGLDSQQIDNLLDLLSQPRDQYEQLFEQPDYARRLFQVFNLNANQSTLQTSLDKRIDSLIINFKLENKTLSFKLGPNRTEPDRKPDDTYQLIILDLVSFFADYNFEELTLTADSKEQRYIDLISEAFNQFIETNSSRYIGFKFENSHFGSNQDVFKLNTQFITNSTTLSLVQNKTIAEMYKMCLTIFRRQRTKTTELLTQQIIDQINSIVERIDQATDQETQIEPADSNSDSNTDTDSATEQDQTNESNIVMRSKLHHYRLAQDINPITERLEVDQPNRGSQPVNIFVGRFQPFTKGHQKVIEKLYAANNLPVVVLVVRSLKPKKDDYKRPFDADLQLDMLRLVSSDLPIESSLIINTASIKQIVEKLRANDYEPVLWGAGEDRVKSYRAQVDKPEYRQDLNVRSDFQIYPIDRPDEDISATKIRQAIADADFETFQRMMPDSLATEDVYDKLQTAMGVKLSESLITFQQFMQTKTYS